MRRSIAPFGLFLTVPVPARDPAVIPIALHQSFRMAISSAGYGTGYYVYHQCVAGTKLSRPIESWEGKTPPPQDVLDLLDRAGTDLLPPPDSDQAKHLGLKEQSGKLDL